MNYEEFASRNLEYYMDMVRLVEIKTKYQMTMTDEEKSINGFILEVQEKNKINELRERFENIWKKNI
jgi:hypothetical protein|tara:strand:+ start:326 stop:526 length:201 start_codon:yes stop_codon:yes gene_type:complete